MYTTPHNISGLSDPQPTPSAQWDLLLVQTACCRQLLTKRGSRGATIENVCQQGGEREFQRAFKEGAASHDGRVSREEATAVHAVHCFSVMPSAVLRYAKILAWLVCPLGAQVFAMYKIQCMFFDVQKLTQACDALIS